MSGNVLRQGDCKRRYFPCLDRSREFTREVRWIQLPAQSLHSRANRDGPPKPKRRSPARRGALGGASAVPIGGEP